MKLHAILAGALLLPCGIRSQPVAVETVSLPAAAALGGGDVVGSPLIGRTYNAGGGPGIWIAADGGFRLYLNGELLAQDNAAGRVTFVPMTFLPGANAISVVGIDGNGAPGVLVQVDELEKTYVSDAGWKVSTTVSDNSWKSRAFNDASWGGRDRQRKRGHDAQRIGPERIRSGVVREVDLGGFGHQFPGRLAILLHHQGGGFRSGHDRR